MTISPISDDLLTEYVFSSAAFEVSVRNVADDYSILDPYFQNNITITCKVISPVGVYPYLRFANLQDLFN